MLRRAVGPRALCAAVVMTAFVVTPSDARAQDAGSLPAVFARLAGEWVGTGTLMGRPGAFSMTWRDSGDGFVLLLFENAWVDEQGTRTPVLSSRAVYRVDGATATGVWIDGRPQRIRLDAVVTDSTLVTRWTADSEEGRTEYVVTSDGDVIVRDYVRTAQGERLFAEATYERR